MADDKLAEMFKTQKSLTEWMEDIQHKDVEALRREDNEKHARLKILKDIIGLPFDEPTQFEAADLNDKNKNFTKFLHKRGEELCALRLIPNEKSLPKVRMRGKSIKDAYAWFLEQDIDASKYRADFLPHETQQIWSTIFIVNKHGMQGEIINGMHYQLTQGFHEGNTPLVFRYDFQKWIVNPKSSEALQHLKILAGHLHVNDPAKQKNLKAKLGSTFAHEYLEGYFETIESNDFGLWFKDYSRTLGKIYAEATIGKPFRSGVSLVSGMAGSPGKARGAVRIVDPKKIDADFPVGGVLVCEVTTPDYVPLMQKASAIVTDQGGILSHAAIVARELMKPCIVGTGNATKVLKNGQTVSVDADLGTVNSGE